MARENPKHGHPFFGERATKPVLPASVVLSELAGAKRATTQSKDPLHAGTDDDVSGSSP
jgi:hypothetical protein